MSVLSDTRSSKEESQDRYAQLRAEHAPPARIGDISEAALRGGAGAIWTPRDAGGGAAGPGRQDAGFCAPTAQVCQQNDRRQYPDHYAEIPRAHCHWRRAFA
jgi:hypothetical protein